MGKLGFLSLVSVLCVVSPFHSVGQKDSSDEGVLYLPSVKPKHEPSDKDFMHLDLNKGYYESLGVKPPLYEINTTEEYGDSAWRDSASNCEIPSDEEGSTSSELICILNIMEGDLNKDIHLVLDIPERMCSYLITEPAWHWNKRPMAQKLDIGGPGRTSWNIHDENEIPLSMLEHTGEGIQKRIEIKSFPMKMTGDRVSGDIPSHSTPIANYIKILDRLPDEGLNIQELPPFLQSFRINPSKLAVPRPYYIFTCLNNKGDPKHEIKLLIQEWNTPKEFLTYYESGGADPSDPNITGAEGKSCDPESQMGMGLCNDLCDLEDIDPKTGHSLCKSSTGYPEANYSLE